MKKFRKITSAQNWIVFGAYGLTPDGFRLVALQKISHLATLELGSGLAFRLTGYVGAADAPNRTLVFVVIAVGYFSFIIGADTA